MKYRKKLSFCNRTVTHKNGKERLLAHSHSTLSKSQIKKRLWRAGVRGYEINRISNEILAGPTGKEMVEMVGIRVLGFRWGETEFREQFGRTISRRVLNFCKRNLIVLDEMAYYINTRFIANNLKSWRKHNVRIGQF